MLAKQDGKAWRGESKQKGARHIVVEHLATIAAPEGILCCQPPVDYRAPATAPPSADPRPARRLMLPCPAQPRPGLIIILRDLIPAPPRARCKPPLHLYRCHDIALASLVAYSYLPVPISAVSAPIHLSLPFFPPLSLPLPLFALFRNFRALFLLLLLQIIV